MDFRLMQVTVHRFILFWIIMEILCFPTLTINPMNVWRMLICWTFIYMYSVDDDSNEGKVIIFHFKYQVSYR